MSTPNPQRIIEVGLGFWPAKTLLSAVELGLFTKLGDRALSGWEIRDELKLHDRAVPDFLDTLVALGFLRRDGLGPDARYANTPETAAFLDRNSSAFIGGFLEMANARLYPFWGDLTEALRTGQPQNEAKHHGTLSFDALYADTAKVERFIAAMAGISTGNFIAFAEQFDFSGYQTLCDVGGASGALALAVAERNPHMRCTTLDLPAVMPIAERTIAAAGLSDRVDAGTLDFFTEPIPPADVITMGMILHDWNLEKKLHLIRAAYDALHPNGAFVAIEHVIDDTRQENAFALLMSLNMLVETGDGFEFTPAQFDEWCRGVGFRETEIIPLGGPASAAVAYK